MRLLSTVICEQKGEVARFRALVESLCSAKIAGREEVTGALLTGSVARGDARNAPLGLFIDIALVVEDRTKISLEEIFGPDEDPFIPAHCVTLEGAVGLSVRVIETSELSEIRSRPESQVFAMNESIILYDPESILAKWKNYYFTISDEQVKQRALDNFFRYSYLTDEYHTEKWCHREAWVQLAQNNNEAAECYCNFLHCINGRFIPRKDWLVYLTFELEQRPDSHDSFIETLYTSTPEKDALLMKNSVMLEIRGWMEGVIRERRWL